MSTRRGRSFLRPIVLLRPNVLLRNVVLLLSLLLLLCSCGSGGGGGGGPTTPNEPSISLSADPGAITAFGQSMLTATARQADGSPVATGTAISFSTSLGNIDNPSVPTDGDGVAMTVLRAGQTAGIATVTAQLGGTAVRASVDVAIGQGTFLIVRAQPEVIAIDGSAQITIIVTNGDGTPFDAGSVVTVSTTVGRLTDERPRTDSSGVATTTLRGNGEAGTATVSADIAGAVEPASVEVVIGNGRTVSLDAQPQSIPLDGSATLTARVRDLQGAGLSGVRVTLSTSLGRLDDARPRTDNAGLATTRLRGAGQVGTATVTATVDGAAMNATTTVDIGQETSLRLVASPPQIAVDGSTLLTVTAAEPGGVPLAGARVQLSTTLGRLDQDRLTTDGLGQTSTTLRGRGDPGTATVTARLTGTDIEASIDIPFVDD